MNFKYTIGSRKFGQNVYTFDIDFISGIAPEIRLNAPANCFGYHDQRIYKFIEDDYVIIPFEHRFVPQYIISSLDKSAFYHVSHYIKAPTDTTKLYFQRNDDLLNAIKSIPDIQYEFAIFHNANYCIFCLKDRVDHYVNPCTEYRLFILYKGMLKPCCAVCASRETALDFARDIIYAEKVEDFYEK